MKKYYFAMVPERSFLDNLVIAAGVGAGLLFGSKYLLGDAKFNAYKQRIREKVFPGAAEKPPAQGPDTGMGIHDTDAKAHEEDEILSRIRAAARKSEG